MRTESLSWLIKESTISFGKLLMMWRIKIRTYNAKVNDNKNDFSMPLSSQEVKSLLNPATFS